MKQKGNLLCLKKDVSAGFGKVMMTSQQNWTW